ncbi:hypothetical protein FHT85_005235 [Rhizobium sp. BK312]|uniref:hypothetical protein n=1 Tax=Rhizobium sp. BK312 TaxID=2587080 RepID=UPI0013AEBA7A|nr:hypothetical protein [Rhizobium sp. BK312]MBB3428214.1 hypothetical protein [Rhizobium sp. BK312]
MTLNQMFRRVETFADDAITVRISMVGGELVASVDFPTFQHGSGKIYRANASRRLPVADALSTAVYVLPETPFSYVAVILDDKTTWQENWGTLI